MGKLTSWAMGGLIKANLSVYFDLIKMGLDHENALIRLVKSRYPLEPGKFRKVMTEMPRIIALNASEERTTLPTKKDELRDLLWTMYCVEVKLDFADTYPLKMELIDKFEDLYDSIKTKYLSA